jgi:hypothetical protein
LGPMTTHISTPENLGYPAGEWYTIVMTFEPGMSVILSRVLWIYD